MFSILFIYQSTSGWINPAATTRCLAGLLVQWLPPPKIMDPKQIGQLLDETYEIHYPKFPWLCISGEWFNYCCNEFWILTPTTQGVGGYRGVRWELISTVLSVKSGEEKQTL